MVVARSDGGGLQVAEPARRLWTLDQFLAFDDGTDRSYELLPARP